jgi:hypothetical protein
MIQKLKPGLIIAIYTASVLLTGCYTDTSPRYYSRGYGSQGGNQYSGTIAPSPSYYKRHHRYNGSNGGNQYNGSVGGVHPGYGNQGGNQYSGSIGGAAPQQHDGNSGGNQYN